MSRELHKVLVLGAGGREHALAWKLAQSPQVEEVFVAPGNAGSDAEQGVKNVALDLSQHSALLEFAQAHGVALTVVGPEAPLVAGIVDRFRAAGAPILGPTQVASALEGSKSFAKAFMTRHAIPTAAYAHFSEFDAAKAYLDERTFPIVIKADGLAAGKGVVIASNREQAYATLEDMMVGGRFAEAGHSVVIEEFLEGEEASFIALVDAQGHIMPFASSQDHKARDDGDLGPNTGGMGAYSPAPVIDVEQHEQVMRDIIVPTVAGMAAEGTPYSGFLYAGLMIGSDRVARVVEFNCRLGDPETQPVLLRLQSDLYALLQATVNGALDELAAQWDTRAALGVVMAAGGYPDAYRKGAAISGLGTDAKNVKVFHAGTARDADTVITAGGRVLCVCALGATVREAQSAAYARAAKIDFADAYYRKDIGNKALARDVGT